MKDRLKKAFISKDMKLIVKITIGLILFFGLLIGSIKLSMIINPWLVLGILDFIYLIWLIRTNEISVLVPLLITIGTTSSFVTRNIGIVITNISIIILITSVTLIISIIKNKIN